MWSQLTHWGRAIRRVACCEPGADAPDSSANEHIYQSLGEQHQAHDAASALHLVVESVDEIRRLLAPIADVQERMRRLELNLHPLLLYRPGDGEYMDMTNAPSPAPAAQPPEPPARSIWLAWLQERVDYGEPW